MTAVDWVRRKLRRLVKIYKAKGKEHKKNLEINFNTIISEI